MAGVTDAGVTALVCTRDRGPLALQAARSILACDRPDLELLVVDQSVSEATAQALGVVSDRRLRFVRTGSTGISRARNEGLRLASHDVVLITDDDCVAKPGWVEAFARAFAAHPEACVGFCEVEAEPHDARLGSVPHFVARGERLHASPLSQVGACGMGAGMGVRRARVLELGGFDEALHAYEDRDVALRALRAGSRVLETATASVVHHGFRSGEERCRQVARNAFGFGAAHAKYVRCGTPSLLMFVAFEAWRYLLRERGRPGIRKLKRARYRAGFAWGLKAPLDRSTLRFGPAAAPPSA